MTRAFTAVPVPLETARKLSKIQESIKVGNPVKPEKMHITFEFFENLGEEEIRKVEDHLQGLEAGSFKVKLKGLGVFPSKNRIRVIWAGVESERISQIYRKACDHPVQSDNSHEFKPHVTLARVSKLRRGEKKKIHEKLRELEGEKLGEFQASRIVFYRSEMRPEGSKYSAIAVKRL